MTEQGFSNSRRNRLHLDTQVVLGTRASLASKTHTNILRNFAGNSKSENAVYRQARTSYVVQLSFRMAARRLCHCLSNSTRLTTCPGCPCKLRPQTEKVKAGAGREKLDISSQNRQGGIAGTKLVKFLRTFSLFRCLPPSSDFLVVPLV